MIMPSCWKEPLAITDPTSPTGCTWVARDRSPSGVQSVSVVKVSIACLLVTRWLSTPSAESICRIRTP